MPSMQELAMMLHIDKSNLDEELERQPVLYYNIATEAAIAKEKREFCKVDLSLLIDEVIADIRTQDSKIAESRVLREAEAVEEVADKRKELIELQKIEAQWNALAVAAMQKSHSLTGLGSLYSNSYFVRDSARNRKNAAA